MLWRSPDKEKGKKNLKCGFGLLVNCFSVRAFDICFGCSDGQLLRACDAAVALRSSGLVRMLTCHRALSPLSVVGAIRSITPTLPILIAHCFSGRRSIEQHVARLWLRGQGFILISTRFSLLHAIRAAFTTGWANGHGSVQVPVICFTLLLSLLFCFNKTLLDLIPLLPNQLGNLFIWRKFLLLLHISTGFDILTTQDHDYQQCKKVIPKISKTSGKVPGVLQIAILVL